MLRPRGNGRVHFERNELDQVPKGQQSMQRPRAAQPSSPDQASARRLAARADASAHAGPSSAR